MGQFSVTTQICLYLIDQLQPYIMKPGFIKIQTPYTTGFSHRHMDLNDCEYAVEIETHLNSYIIIGVGDGMLKVNCDKYSDIHQTLISFPLCDPNTIDTVRQMVIDLITQELTVYCEHVT